MNESHVKSVEIEIKDVHKHLGATHALNGVSLLFDDGLMHGLIGPEGAGKTTLFRHIVGLLKPNSGELKYKLEYIETGLESIRSKIAYMPQSQSLYPDLSIAEHLDFFKNMYQISEEAFAQKRERLLEITRLKKFQDRLAGQLSGGMYKKLGLMCALMSSPWVLLLDEPTNGVDPISRREFWELLYDLRDQKLLIIVATSYMDEAERCSKVHLLHQGHVIGAGEPKDLLQQQGVQSFDEYFLRFESYRASEEQSLFYGSRIHEEQKNSEGQGHS